MANQRSQSSQLEEEGDSQLESQASMMSPATTRLLADMNLSRKAVPCKAVAGSKNHSHSITSNTSNQSSATNDDPVTNNNNNRRNDDRRRRPLRNIGPNECNYTQNYENYITRTIQQYITTTQPMNNIGKLSSSLLSVLPSYKMMNEEERSVAMRGVDALLERLTLEMNNNDDGSDDDTYSLEDGGQQGDESFGSVTTMGQHQNNTTMNKSIGSETTMMEQSMSLLGTTTSTSSSAVNGANSSVEQSMSLLSGNNNNNSSNYGRRGGLGVGGTRKSIDSDATTAYEQSMSLLDNESHLFTEETTVDAADDGGGNSNNNSGEGGDKDDNSDDDDDESRFSRGGDMTTKPTSFASTTQNNKAVPPPIEKVRRYQSNDNDNNRMMTSPQYNSSYNNKNKRCASNSGKRGLKSRSRFEDDGGGGDMMDDDDSLLQHFDHTNNYKHDGSSNDDDGMFFPSQEDEFSPIQHRFSHDGLESPDYDNGGRGRGDDDARLDDGNNKLLTQQGENDDDVSFGCNYNGGYDDDDDEYGGADYGGNNDWDEDEDKEESQRPLATQLQRSQWSTFKTVDPTATQTQTNYDEDAEDSPVKRRVIHFESTQKYSHQNDNEKIQSMRAELEDMAVTSNDDQDDSDPIQTVGNLCRRARSCNESGMDTSLLDEVAPIDVRLRDGHLFHKDPLQCRQVQKKKKKVSSKGKTTGTKTVRIAKSSDRHAAAAYDSEESLSDPDPSFTDPTSTFPSRVADRLNAAFDFMIENTNNDNNDNAGEVSGDKNAGVLLSLDLRQTMAVTSKLLLTTKKLARSHRNSKNRKTASTPSTSTAVAARDVDYLAGGTLIILRTKEDLPKWEVALREYTSLSVLSHNSLQANQRKTPNAAAKCAAYDVVLTTYDLLKSKEATIPVDSLGIAILKNDSKSNADDGGWLNARGSGSKDDEPQKCHQLSILHRMSWYRVIMMDSLGRLGYTIKPNTARSIAVTAINSLSRFIFFVKEEKDDKLESKFKNDRKQIKSVLEVLHLPIGTKAIDFLQQSVHDVKSNSKDTGSDLDSSSCNEDDEESNGSYDTSREYSME